MSINKAVLYLFLAAACSPAGTMIWIAQADAGAAEPRADRRRGAYDLTSNNITRGNMDGEHGGEVVPVHRHAVLLHLVLEPDRLHPAADEHRAQDRRSSALEVPSFALYAATANISVPLVLTLVVWFSYHIEGIRAKGFVRLLQELGPGGHAGRAASRSRSS